MPTVLTLSGSPSPRSRSSGLLRLAARQVEARGLQVDSLSASDFPPDVLLGGNVQHPAVHRFRQAVAAADGLLIATPVYQAAYSGVLKLLLDLLPQRALEHAAVLPLATGGSLAHMLAIDYALQPVLSALKARHVLGGVYAVEQDLAWRDDGRLDIALPVCRRLREALDRFVAHLGQPPIPAWESPAEFERPAVLSA